MLYFVRNSPHEYIIALYHNLSPAVTLLSSMHDFNKREHSWEIEFFVLPNYPVFVCYTMYINILYSMVHMCVHMLCIFANDKLHIIISFYYTMKAVAAILSYRPIVCNRNGFRKYCSYFVLSSITHIYVHLVKLVYYANNWHVKEKTNILDSRPKLIVSVKWNACKCMCTFSCPIFNMDEQKIAK